MAQIRAVDIVNLTSEIKDVLNMENRLWKESFGSTEPQTLSEKTLSAELILQCANIKHIHAYFRDLDSSTCYQVLRRYRAPSTLHGNFQDIRESETANRMHRLSHDSLPRSTESRNRIDPEYLGAYKGAVICAQFPCFGFCFPDDDDASNSVTSSANFENSIGVTEGALSDHDQGTVPNVVTHETLAEHIRLCFGLDRQAEQFYRRAALNLAKIRSANDILADELSSQWLELERNCHAYYSPRKFVSLAAYASWQCRRRRELYELKDRFGIESFSNRVSLNQRIRNMEYRKLVETFLSYDTTVLGTVGDVSRNNVFSVSSERILQEFRARFGVGEGFHNCCILCFFAERISIIPRFIGPLLNILSTISASYDDSSRELFVIKTELELLEFSVMRFYDYTLVGIRGFGESFRNNTSDDNNVGSVLRMLHVTHAIKLHLLPKVDSLGHTLEECVLQGCSSAYDREKRSLLEHYDMTSADVNTSRDAPSVVDALVRFVIENWTEHCSHLANHIGSYFDVESIIGRHFYKILMTDVEQYIQKEIDTLSTQQIFELHRRAIGLLHRLNQLDEQWNDFVFDLGYTWRSLAMHMITLWLDIFGVHATKFVKASARNNKFSPSTILFVTSHACAAPTNNTPVRLLSVGSVSRSSSSAFTETKKLDSHCSQSLDGGMDGGHNYAHNNNYNSDHNRIGSLDSITTENSHHATTNADPHSQSLSIEENKLFNSGYIIECHIILNRLTHLAVELLRVVDLSNRPKSQSRTESAGESVSTGQGITAMTTLCEAYWDKFSSVVNRIETNMADNILWFDFCGTTRSVAAECFNEAHIRHLIAVKGNGVIGCCRHAHAGQRDCREATENPDSTNTSAIQVESVESALIRLNDLYVFRSLIGDNKTNLCDTAIQDNAANFFALINTFTKDYFSTCITGATGLLAGSISAQLCNFLTINITSVSCVEEYGDQLRQKLDTITNIMYDGLRISVLVKLFRSIAVGVAKLFRKKWQLEDEQYYYMQFFSKIVCQTLQTFTVIGLSDAELWTTDVEHITDMIDIRTASTSHIWGAYVLLDGDMNSINRMSISTDIEVGPSIDYIEHIATKLQYRTKYFCGLNLVKEIELQSWLPTGFQGSYVEYINSILIVCQNLLHTGILIEFNASNSAPSSPQSDDTSVLLSFPNIVEVSSELVSDRKISITSTTENVSGESSSGYVDVSPRRSIHAFENEDHLKLLAKQLWAKLYFNDLNADTAACDSQVTLKFKPSSNTFYRFRAFNYSSNFQLLRERRQSLLGDGMVTSFSVDGVVRSIMHKIKKHGIPRFMLMDIISARHKYDALANDIFMACTP